MGRTGALPLTTLGALAIAVREAVANTQASFAIADDGLQLSQPSQLHPMHSSANAPASSASSTSPDRIETVAALRLLVGELLEEILRRKWIRTMDVTAGVGGASGGSRRRSRSRSSEAAVPANASTLLFASYAAAVWTSMHAEFLALPPEGRQLTEPSLASVPSQSNEAGLCAMLDDNGFSGAPSPRSNPLQQLLGRCVHPASRGWAPTLQTLVSTHECVRLALGTAMLVSATGLHPCIRPTARPPWRWRMRILRAGRHALLQNAAALLLANVEVTKEIVRRLLAGALCDSIAGLAVARHLGCAAARVISPRSANRPRGCFPPPRKL